MNGNQNSSLIELVKFFQLEVDHINLQLLITIVILALELASLELVNDDSTWFDISDIPLSGSRMQPCLIFFSEFYFDVKMPV